MVLRSKSVGEQDAAGHQGAFCQGEAPSASAEGASSHIQAARLPRRGGPRGRVRPPPGPFLASGTGRRRQPPRPASRGVTGPWERAVTRCVARLTAVYMRRLHRGESR